MPLYEWTVDPTEQWSPLDPIPLEGMTHFSFGRSVLSGTLDAGTTWTFQVRNSDTEPWRTIAGGTTTAAGAGLTQDVDIPAGATQLRPPLTTINTTTTGTNVVLVTLNTVSRVYT